MESTNTEDVANGIVSKNNTQTSQIQELQTELSQLRKLSSNKTNEMLTKKREKLER